MTNGINHKSKVTLKGGQ